MSRYNYKCINRIKLEVISRWRAIAIGEWTPEYPSIKCYMYMYMIAQPENPPFFQMFGPKMVTQRWIRTFPKGGPGMDCEKKGVIFNIAKKKGSKRYPRKSIFCFCFAILKITPYFFHNPFRAPILGFPQAPL